MSVVRRYGAVVVLRLILACVLAVVAGLVGMPTGQILHAQGQQTLVPGRNVNMVSGTKWPDGDPYLHGLFYYAGLAFDRAENGRSAVFVARFIDNNNQEDNYKANQQHIVGDPIQIRRHGHRCEQQRQAIPGQALDCGGHPSRRSDVPDPGA